MRELIEVALFSDNVEAVAGLIEAIVAQPPAFHGPGIAVFESDGLKILVHRKSGAMEGGPPNEDHIAFAAEDVDAACRELAAQGYTIAFQPQDYDWGRSAYLRDADGRLVEIHQAS